MSEEKYFELPELEEFFKEIGADISRTTITRYGQNGLMLVPKRKKSLEGRNDSRIYYHPIVVIEILVAYMMLNGEFGQIGGKTKMAMFTTDDIFFARLRHHLNVDRLRSFPIKDYYATIRVPIGKKMKTFPLFFPDKLYSMACFEDTYKLVSKYWGDSDLAEDEMVVKLLHDRYKDYISLFTPPGIKGHELEDIQRTYLQLLDELYGVLFDKMLEKHENWLKTFKY